MYHTRTNVKIDVCTYNRTTQGTSIATLTNASFLPDALEWALVCGMVALLVLEMVRLRARRKMYANYFNQVLRRSWACPTGDSGINVNLASTAY
jgi:hypothetical protein